MENNNTQNIKFYYCGLLYLFLANLIIDASECFLNLVAGFCNLNIWIVPIVLTIGCIILVYFLLFHRMYNKKMKPLVFILILFVCMGISKLFAQLFSYEMLSTDYSMSEKGLVYSVNSGIKGLFMLAVGVIAYIKYYRIKE